MALALVVIIASAGCGDKSRREATTATNGNGSDPGPGCDSEAPSDSDATSDSSAPFLAYTNWRDSVSIVRADGTQRRRLADSAPNPSWSPDGSAVASRKSTGELFLVDIASGKQTTIDAHTDQFGSSDVTWEPSGKRLAYSRLRPGDRTYHDLWIADRSGSASVAVEYASPAAWSPDGRWLAYRMETPPADPTSFSPPPQLPEGPKRGTIGGPLRVLEVASGAVRQLSGDGFLPYGTGIQVWSPDSRLIAYWRSYPGNVGLSGDLFAQDIDSGRELAIGSYTAGGFPGWGSMGARDILGNLAIDPATDNIVELFPKPQASLAVSSGGGIAVVVEGSPDGGRDLVARDLGSGARTVIQHSAVAITSHLEPGFQAAIQPAGRYVAYLAITEVSRSSRSSPALEPKEVGPLNVVDLAAGTSTLVANEVFFRPGVLAFSHDGQWLSVQRAGDPISICVARADGSAPHRVADGMIFGTFDHSDPWRPQ